jgi:hypothetical protein
VLECLATAEPPGERTRQNKQEFCIAVCFSRNADLASERCRMLFMLDCPGYRESSARQWAQPHARVSGGLSFQHRGPFTANATYAAGDIAMIGGSAFLALRDNPGSCPCPSWRLLAAVGKRGPKGEPGVTPPTISGWHVDPKSFTVTPVMSDGTRGPPLELFDLFREFLQRM